MSRMFPSRASACSRSISAGGGVRRPRGGAHMMRRRGRLDHQIEAESASRTDPARHFDVTSHELYVAAADRQAEPGATAALPLGNLLEGLEDGLELIGGNADAGILDLESQPLRLGTPDPQAH